VDTSLSDYSNNFDYWYYSSSALVDTRSGEGTDVQNTHRMAANMRLRLDQGSTLSFGLDFQTVYRETETTEGVVGRRRYDWSYTNEAVVDLYRYSARERKDLEWRFHSRNTQFALPIHFAARVSDHLAVELGVNRRLVIWRISDETISRYDFLEETANDQVSLRENFGERFQMPETRQSEVRTTAIAGFTVRPVHDFGVRVLLAPEHRRYFYNDTDFNLRWWIAFTLDA
jgi:hypothetical protein